MLAGFHNLVQEMQFFGKVSLSKHVALIVRQISRTQNINLSIVSDVLLILRECTFLRIGIAADNSCTLATDQCQDVRRCTKSLVYKNSI